METLNLKKGVTYFEKILVKIAKVFSERGICFCIENGENVIFQNLQKKFEFNKNIYAVNNIEERKVLNLPSCKLVSGTQSIIYLIFESPKNEFETLEKIKVFKKFDKPYILFAVRKVLINSKISLIFFYNI